MDFDSPERWPDVPYDTAAPSARHAAAMRAHIVSVLGDAAQTMARSAPAAQRLVERQLQRVLLRADQHAPGGSASHRAHVGSCLLTNLHQPVDAVLVATEAVTHEAIHQLIYRTEQASGHFCDLAETPTFRSPWSGARLPLHSLVHACFVWFGLLHLWSELARAPALAPAPDGSKPAAESDDEAATAHARGRIAHCLFGFAFLEDLLASPAFPKARVDPQVLAAIRGMSAAARRATRAAEPQVSLRQVASVRLSADWPQAVAVSLASDES